MARKSGRFNLVVVPLDGSHWAEHALPCAAAVARAAKARLRLVLVHQLPPPPTDRASLKIYTSLEVAVRKNQRGYLKKVAARLREGWGIPVTSVSPEGPVGPTLVRFLDELGADLVVMATHGRGALGRALLGSVADHVVRAARVPVLLVRPPDDESPPPDATWTASEILVPLDGSSVAEAALEPAADLARLLGARLSLVQVVVPLASATDPPLPFPMGYDQHLTELRRREAQVYLDRVAERLRAGGLTAGAAAVVGPSAAGALTDLTRPGRADMIAIASHGHGALHRVALGSVADKLVRAAEVPVLVIRVKGTG
ncbi:MAG TPA: universal stress protein [Gemmatimonadales bacterium]|nr:universal stress protein [Gemmatimonadales bacterium]